MANATQKLKAEVLNVALIQDKKQLDLELAALKTKGKTMSARIHRAALSVLWHIDTYGDIRVADKLVDAVVAAKYGDYAIKSWLVSFGKLSYEDKKFSYDKTKTTNLVGAKEHPFWKFTPEAPAKPLDLQAAIVNLLKRVKKAQDDGTEIVHPELLEKLKVFDSIK